MDPSKKIGQIKEQVELENISRRRYPDKWGKVTGKDVNRFYNQAYIDKCIQKTMAKNDFKEIWPYSYTGHGDSYFVSKDMYEMLVAKCRCGRQRTKGHTINCLQKVPSKYLTHVSDRESSSIASGDDVPGREILGKYTNEPATNGSDDSSKSFNGSNQSRASGGGRRRSRIPETSNGMIGWPASRYGEWEQSTKYVSPIVTMPGYKVAERPYSVIFIG